MDGIAAQMNFDKINFSMNIYSEYQFEKLLRVVILIYHIKYNKLLSKDNISTQEKEK